MQTADRADDHIGEPALHGATTDGPRTRWAGENWSPGRRVILIVGAALVYALAFGPLYRIGGLLAAAPLANLLIAGAATLLGLRAGLVASAIMLPLNILLLNAAGEAGVALMSGGGGAFGSAALFVTGGAVGWLSDLVRRDEALGREIARQRSSLEAEISARARAEARYRDLVENATDLIYTHDLAGKLTNVNAAVESALGYTRDELAGAPIEDLIVPTGRAQARAVLTRLLGGENPGPY